MTTATLDKPAKRAATKPDAARRPVVNQDLPEGWPPEVPADMTEEQFMAWAFAQEFGEYEWVDGEVIVMSPVSQAHSNNDFVVGSVARCYVEEKKLGWVGRDMFVRLPDRRQLRVPDLMFVAEARRGIVGPTVIDGPPDWVVEIVSPDSVARDYREKHAAYEAAGIGEYWIIDPLSQTFEAHRLEGGRYVRVEPDAEGKVHSTAIRGFWLRPCDRFREDRPTIVDVLRELGVA